jgi:predicted amidophosphoribosyltransferase
MGEDGDMPCHRCGRIQTDPVKGASPWGRGVLRGEQVLVCPACQAEDSAWMEELDRCPRCGGTRLSVVMGSVVCRSCSFDWPADDARLQ